MSDFTTKDSGARQEFASGMQRDTQDDKPRYDLVFSGPLLKRWAELLHRGAQKYDANNWMKAESVEELERFRASAARHFAQWMNGETDEDHAAAVVFNLNGYEYTLDRLVEQGLDVPVPKEDPDLGTCEHVIGGSDPHSRTIRCRNWKPV